MPEPVKTNAPPSPTPAAPAASAAPAAPPPATPVASPAPSPAPSGGAPPGASGPGDDSPFAVLDAKIKEFDAPRPTTTGKAEPTKPSGAPQPPQAPTKGPKELRAELDRLNGELGAKTRAYNELETKIAEFEKRGKDTTVLTDRLAAMEKALADKESEIRTIKQEASPEFKEKWDKPFDQAAEYAKSVITQLTVEDSSGTPRQARWDDFVELYNMPYNKAFAVAREKFGDAAQMVINHMTELHRLQHNRNNALQEERTEAMERSKKEEADRIGETERINTAWKTVNEDLSTKVEGYKDTPEDKELSDLRQQGYQIFDSETKTLQQRIVKNAHIRQRVAAYGPNQLQIKRLTTKVAELTKELEKYTAVPDANKRTGGQTAPAAGGDWEAEARKALAS